MKVSFSINKAGEQVDGKDIADLADVDKLLAALKVVADQANTTLSKAVDLQIGTKDQAKVKKNPKKKDSDQSNSSEEDED